MPTQRSRSPSLGELKLISLPESQAFMASLRPLSRRSSMTLDWMQCRNCRLELTLLLVWCSHSLVRGRSMSSRMASRGFFP
jgi:hypothetical protein